MSNLMEDANVQVRRLVQRVLSLPDNYMRPSHQRADAAQQGVPFGTVLIMSPNAVGTVARSTEDDGAGGLNEVLQSPTKFTASVQFFKASPRPAKLRGGQITDVIASYTGVTNGGFDIAVDGGTLKVTGLSLAAAADMNAVAAAVQAKLVALLAGVTVAWTGKRLIVTSPTTGQTSAAGTAVSPTGTGSPVDVSALLGLTAAAGATPSDNKTGLAKQNLEAVELARRLKLLLQSDVHTSYMQAVGLGFLKAGEARDLAGIDDANWEGRSSIDLDFNVIAREVVPVAAFAPPFTAGLKAISPGPSIAPNGLIREIDISVTPPT